MRELRAVRSTALIAMLFVAGGAFGAETASPADKVFVGKVSQGGMFEVEAGKVAVDKADAQDVKDLAVMEVHDHELVGDKLKSIAGGLGLPIAGSLNAEFAGRLERLKGLSGPSFDKAYLSEMIKVHNIDGGLFAQEAKAGGSASLKAFAAETVKIVDRHIGALHPKPRS